VKKNVCNTIQKIFTRSSTQNTNFRSGLISYYRYSSCCCCSFCWGDVFKKAQDSATSNQTGLKFGRNVHHINTHFLTETDFSFDVIISRRCHGVISQRKVLLPAECTVHRYHLLSAYAAASTSSWFMVLLYLFYNTSNRPVSTALCKNKSQDKLL